MKIIFAIVLIMVVAAVLISHVKSPSAGCAQATYNAQDYQWNYGNGVNSNYYQDQETEACK